MTDITRYNKAVSNYWLAQGKITTMRNTIQSENDKTAELQEKALERGAKDLTDALARSELNAESLKNMGSSITATSVSMKELASAIAPENAADIEINDIDDDEEEDEEYSSHGMEVDSDNKKLDLLNRVHELRQNVEDAALILEMRKQADAADKEAEFELEDEDTFYSVGEQAKSVDALVSKRQQLYMKQEWARNILEEHNLNPNVIKSRVLPILEKAANIRQAVTMLKAQTAQAAEAKNAADDPILKMLDIKTVKSPKQLREWTAAISNRTKEHIEELKTSKAILEKLREKNNELNIKNNNQLSMLDKQIEESSVKEESKLMLKHVRNTASLVNPTAKTKNVALKAVEQIEAIVETNKALEKEDEEAIQKLIRENQKIVELNKELEKELKK